MWTPDSTPLKPFKLVAICQHGCLFQRSSPFHLPALASALAAALSPFSFLLCIVRRMGRNSRRV